MLTLEVYSFKIPLKQSNVYYNCGFETSSLAIPLLFPKEKTDATR